MKCFVENCFTYYEPKKGDVSFFKVPSSPELNKAWMNALPENSRPLSVYSRICSHHFLDTDFIFCKGRKRLVKNAIPSVFGGRKIADKDPLNFAIQDVTMDPEVDSDKDPLNFAFQDVAMDPEVDSEYQEASTSTYAAQVEINLVQAESTSLQSQDCQQASTSAEDSHILQTEFRPTKALQIENKTTRKVNVERRQSLKWAMETADEEGCNKLVVLQNKVAILRKYVKLKSARINALKAKCRRRNQRVKQFSHLLDNLTKQNFINEDDRDVLANMPDSHRNVLEEQLLRGKHVTSTKPYSEVLKKFAMNLNFYSPRAYAYVRNSLSGCLPHPRTIKRWYSSSKCEPGFTEEAFIALRGAVQKASEDNQKLVCNLVFDEMAIRERIEWDHGKAYGYVDIGNGVDSDVRATQVLVFMVVCINRSWKLPIGYFPISSITSEQKVNLLSHCIGLLVDIGIVLLGVTFDGAANNVTLARILKCDIKEDLPSYTFRLEGIDDTFCIFPDPCHMIKLVRNVFAELSPLVNGSGEEINWKYLVELEKLQESEGLHLGNKVKKAHIYFQRQKMKVKLATQLLSKSVADAIDFCRTELKLPQFAGSEATSQFILILNDAFDILNSRRATDYGNKRAMSCQNFPAIYEYASEICDYLRSLKLSSGEFLVDHRRRLGFLGIIVCLRNLSFIYEKVLASKILIYVPIYKLNQDPVELFFSSVRCRQGYNNNPTVKQLKATYTHLLVHCQIREGGIGNAIPLENIPILQCSPLPDPSPMEQINSSIDRFRMLDESVAEDTSEGLEEEIFIAYHTPQHALTEYAEKVVEYIAGFIVFKIEKSLQCTECLSALESDMVSNSLIAYKSFGYLKTPSDSVKRICQVTEKMLKCALASLKENSTILSSKAFQQIIILVQRELIGTPLFVSINDHFQNNNHYGNLIKIIAQKYLDIRFHSIARHLGQKDSVRNFYHRLVLFKGM